jgi:hypothetical protein
LFLYPGAVLFVLGALGLLLGLMGPPVTTALHLGVHTLLYLAGATILGVQFLIFALLTKWIAVLASLVPEPGWLGRWGAHLTIENGLILGFGAFAVGLFSAAWLTLDWGRSGFGPLDPVESMRFAIPSVTLMAGGMQVGIASFFAGALHFCWQSARGSFS